MWAHTCNYKYYLVQLYMFLTHPLLHSERILFLHHVHSLWRYHPHTTVICGSHLQHGCWAEVGYWRRWSSVFFWFLGLHRSEVDGQGFVEPYKQHCYFLRTHFLSLRINCQSLLNSKTLSSPICLLHVGMQDNSGLALLDKDQIPCAKWEDFRWPR